MATISVTVLDQATGKPIADAAVVVTIYLLPDVVASGFTSISGVYLAPIPRSLLPIFYAITVTAKGYTSTTANRTAIGGTTVYYETQLTPKPVELPAPLSYPAVVGVNAAPDLLITAPEGFDEVLVKVEGAFPSSSRSPVPDTGTVVVPMAARLLVAPPTSLVLISHDERVRQANELRQVYTIIVSGRTNNRVVQLGTLVTTAILAEVDELVSQLAISPWLVPWPGVVPVERGGYTEVALALPRLAAANTYTLYISGHTEINGPIAAQDIRTFAVAGLSPNNSSYQPYRIRVPDFAPPHARLLLSSALGPLPPLWFTYRA